MAMDAARQALARQTLERAIALHGAGQPGLAEPLYRSVLAARPGDATALHCLGLLLHQTGRSADAAPLLAESARLNSGNADTHELLALVLRRLGRTAEAAESYHRALRLKPANPDARTNLGNALAELGRADEALACFHEAIRLAPASPEAHNGLGNALVDLGRADEAVACFAEAIRLRPAFAAAHNSLGVAYFEARRLDEAVACFREAIRLDPGYAEAHNNLGAVLTERGDQADALPALRRAVELQPDYPDAHYHLAVALLRQGDFAEGWAEYEWRRLKSGFPRRDPALPEWDGALPAGTVLAYAEQGLGDALQFVRYAPLLAATGARVVLEVPKALVRLASSVAGVAAVVAAGTPPPRCDVQVPLMSLPHLLRPQRDTIPGAPPYLHPDPAAAAAWGRRLAGLPGLKVGLAWAGAPRPHDRQSNLVDRRRSLGLDQFAPLAGIDGFTLVSLQKGPAAAQGAAPPDRLALVDLMDEVGDFADTAALAANLDLVISVDTSVAHLAGALGRPVWILSRYDGCWRWLLDRADSPWYPTARLFRQPRPGDWAPVVEAVRAALAETVAEADHA
jgi:tetratricopeptide (TPR) repeat protein